MGKRGPPPKPPSLKLVTGNPGHRPIGAPEPEADRGEPLPPAFLTPRAVEEWDRLMPMLLEMGLMAHVYRGQLAAYCQCYAHWMHAEEQMAIEGYTAVGATGNDIVSPWYKIAKDANDRMVRYGAAFGLAPATCGSVKALPKPASGKENNAAFAF